MGSWELSGIYYERKIGLNLKSTLSWFVNGRSFSGEDWT